MRTGCWTILYLQVPGHERVPAGVLLWDPLGDSLLLARRELLENEKEPDLVEFWQEFEEFFSSVIDEMGGSAALLWLESGASHSLQIGVRTEAQIDSAGSLVKSLFAEFVSPGKTENRFGADELARAQVRVPLLPSIALQVVAAMNNPRADSREIERAISRDPIIAAHLIRVANLASLNIREPARTLGSAIHRIGFDAARLHIIGLAVGRMYSSPRSRKLWEHSVHVAQMARDLATSARVDREEAGLLGLIHDIGQIVMSGIGDEFYFEYAQLHDSGVTSIAAEMTLCGTGHPDVGADLLHSWYFPKDMCEAVRYHHDPLQAKSPLASILYLAESCSERNEDIYDPFERLQVIDRLGIKRDSMTSVRVALDADLQVLRSAA